jgi:hypothetical protein
LITLQAFLTGVQENIARITHYELGDDGSGGGCDCIGLIIGALELCGFDWPGVHGSNWAARNAMTTLDYIADARNLFPGEIVYKAKEPGESSYSLPSSYRNSPDQRDYYHVGVVTSVNPLCITHCTGVDGGIKRDNALGKWRWGGKLKYVNYDKEDKPMECLYEAKVYAENGFPVKMRSQPSTKSTVIASLPVGTIVDVYDVMEDWCGIRYNGQSGYMMSKFLEPILASQGPSEPISGTAVAVNRADLETVKTALETALNVIDKMLVG